MIESPLHEQFLSNVIDIRKRFFLPQHEMYVSKHRSFHDALFRLSFESSLEEWSGGIQRNDPVERGIGLYRSFFRLTKKIGKKKMPPDGFQPFQLQVCTSFGQAILPYFFGEQVFEEHEVTILSRLKIDRFRSEALLAAPRRMGKSESVAASVAVMLYIVPHIEILVFSTSGRTSGELKQKITDYLNLLPDSARRKIEDNQERITLRGDDFRDVRRLKAFPSNSKTLRGQGGKVIVLEEAAYCAPSVFQEVVFPIWGVGYTAVIAISTLCSEQDNFFTRLMNVTDSGGNPRFNVIHFQFVCPECREKEPNRDKPCIHRMHLMPKWKSESKQQVIASLLSETLIRTELLGELGDDEGVLFPVSVVRDAVDAFGSQMPTDYGNTPDHPYVFIGLDPNGFGADSAFALVSIAAYAGKIWVLGMEFEPSDIVDTPDKQVDLLVRHVKALQREYDFLRRGRVVFIPESNMAYIGCVLYGELQQRVVPAPILFSYNIDLKSAPAKQFGVYTNHRTKELMVMHMQGILRNHALAVGSKVVCVGEFCNKEGVERPKKVVEELYSELTCFRRLRYSSKDGTRQSYRYTGKKQGGSGKDDLAMAIMIAAFYRQHFLTSPAYFGDIHDKIVAEGAGPSVRIPRLQGPSF